METLVPQTELSGSASEAQTTWRSVQSGIWVGSRGGALAGMIEQRWGNGFLVTTRLGQSLGTFGTLAEARQALG